MNNILSIPTEDDSAYFLAHMSHQGKFRRDGRTPYINHPMDVAQRLDDRNLKAIAYLHDSLEDTTLTVEEMRKWGISEGVISVVQILTHREEESYQDYLGRVKANSHACAVKIADMLCNLSDDPTPKQIRKYARGLIFLTECEPLPETAS